MCLPAGASSPGSCQVTIIGGGLAGSEAAWQLASRGFDVELHEMRPAVRTGAHQTGNLAELVCSNSFKSNLPHTASGQLKREMRLLGSFILSCAESAAVSAGEALAVDREAFAAEVEQRLGSLDSLRIRRCEMVDVPPEGLVIVATGPLTSEKLAEKIGSLTDSRSLFFYDAVAPIVEADSIDPEHSFEASRYGKGEAAYINCPLDREQYEAIWEAIVSAELVKLHEFEDARFFEGCLPLEEIARRGPLTLAHGPWKPVGLIDPRTGRRPHAVVQLRRENLQGSCYSLVACQSRMTWPEQRRIFAMIPALASASFLRLGVVHRNTYLDSPRLLNDLQQLRSDPRITFAGQIVGVEGYLESAASGLLAGLNAGRSLERLSPYLPPADTMLGALTRYISNTDVADFAPMNANFGLLAPSPIRGGKQARRADVCDRAFTAMEASVEEQAPAVFSRSH